MSPDPRFVQVVDKLSQIQARTGHFLRIPNSTITVAEQQVVAALASVVQMGRVARRYKEIRGEFSVEKLQSPLEAVRSGNRVSFSESFESSSAELFGRTFEMGPVDLQVSGAVQNTNEELRKVIEDARLTRKLALHLTDVEIAEIYPHWTPGKSPSQ